MDKVDEAIVAVTPDPDLKMVMDELEGRAAATVAQAFMAAMPVWFRLRDADQECEVCQAEA